MRTQTQEPEQHSRRPFSPVVIPFVARDKETDFIIRESENIARQSRRDSVPLPDFKLRRRNRK